MTSALRPACSSWLYTALSMTQQANSGAAGGVIDARSCTPLLSKFRFCSGVAELLTVTDPVERIASRLSPPRRFRFFFVVRPKFGQTTINIGRERFANNDIVVPHKSVSLLHATLKKIQGQWYVCDGTGDTRPSKNGVLVNGTRIARSYPIKTDDLISLGDRESPIALKFYAGECAKENQTYYEMAAAYARLVPEGFESLVRQSPGRIIESLIRVANGASPMYLDLNEIYLNHPGVAAIIHQGLLDAALDNPPLQALICERGDPNAPYFGDSRINVREHKAKVERAKAIWAQTDIKPLIAGFLRGNAFANRILHIVARAGNEEASTLLEEVAVTRGQEERAAIAVKIIGHIFGAGASERLKTALSKIHLFSAA